MNRVKRIAAFLWKTLLGAIFCQSLVLSVLVVGWTYRTMQRAAVKRWLAECIPNAALTDAARDVPALSHLRTWPHWFRAPAEEPKRMRRWFGGFRANAALGFSGLVTTWSLTLVPMLMWNMSWYAGWNNSPKLGRRSVPVCFFARQIGDSGRKGRITISGIAGTRPDMSV